MVSILFSVIVLILIALIIYSAIQSFIFWNLLRWLASDRKGFLPAMKVAFPLIMIVRILGLFPPVKDFYSLFMIVGMYDPLPMYLITFFLSSILIKHIYRMPWKKAFLIGIIWILATAILDRIMVFLFPLSDLLVSGAFRFAP